MRLEYVPLPHWVHFCGPGAGLYVPSTHAGQGPPSAPEKPALQMQSSLKALRCGALELAEHARQSDSSSAPGISWYFPALQSTQPSEASWSVYVPAGQSSHAAEPGTLLKEPRGHAGQNCPSGAEYPALHLHSVMTSEPRGDEVLPGHGSQVEAFGAAMAVEKVWTGHWSQTVEARDSWYVPAKQFEQPCGPRSFLNSPRGHAVQSWPFGPV